MFCNVTVRLPSLNIFMKIHLNEKVFLLEKGENATLQHTNYYASVAWPVGVTK